MKARWGALASLVVASVPAAADPPAQPTDTSEVPTCLGGCVDVMATRGSLGVAMMSTNLRGNAMDKVASTGAGIDLRGGGLEYRFIDRVGVSAELRYLHVVEQFTVPLIDPQPAYVETLSGLQMSLGLNVYL